MLFLKTFDENKIGTRAARLVFVDAAAATAGGEQGQTRESSDFIYRPNVEDWKNESYEKYEEHIVEAKNLGKIDGSQAFSLLRNAKSKFEKWTAENSQRLSVEEYRKKIEEGRKNKVGEKIAGRVVDAVRARYLTEIADIRNLVRKELRDFLEIPSGEKIEEIIKDESWREFLQFENEIFTRITELLQENDYAVINATIERDKKRSRECYQKLKAFFTDAARKNFLLNVLKLKGIPAGDRMNINTLNVFAKQMEGRWENTDSLVGVVKPEELIALEQSLNAVESFYQKWNSITEIKERNTLERELFGFEKTLQSFNDDMRENPPKAVELAWLVEIWPDLFKRFQADWKRLRALLAEDQSEANRRLAQAFLEGSAEELKKLKDARGQVEIQSRPKTKKDEQSEQAPEQNDSNIVVEAPRLGMTEHGGHGHGGHAPNALNKLGKAAKEFFTARGRIRWYSFHDIEESFKLIAQSWKKHTESHTEDKSGVLADKLMFWREEVRRRVHETDLIKEKGRADERKKRYKNVAYEELIAEAIDLPAKDKRRAILEVLAERGNLRMSDHRLINAVTNNSISAGEWNYADRTCDYANIITKFKRSVDTYYIGEIGYGQQLIDMQTSGQANKESLGEKLGDHTVAGSPGAECGMVAVQIDNAGLEGDNVLTGILKKGFGRGNKHTDNLNFCKINIRTDKGDVVYRENATAGLDALKIVDGYLKGLISNQTIAGLSKKNEAGYTPYAAFQDILTSKKKDPDNPDRYISDMEKWGWIEHGVITELGKQQIINFFDSRVAFDKDGKIIHIASASATYSRHSTKYTSISDFRGLGIPVADKMRTTCIKAGGLEIYDNATQRAQGTNQLIGQQQEVTFLIKAACEEIEDGITMIRHGQDDTVKADGKNRLEKGTKAIEIMLGNIVKNTEDRRTFSRGYGNPAYNIMQRKKNIEDKVHYGRVVGNDNINTGGLWGFLEYYLTTLTGADQDPAFRDNYLRIKRAYENFEDESNILPRDVRDAKARNEEEALRKKYSEVA
ncbi:MAG: hypothetical protein V1936_02340 [Patescibacteria group bacterium]